VRIDAVDPSSERDLTDAAAVETAYWREVLGEDEPARTAADFRFRVAVGRPDRTVHVFVARDGDEPVGMAHVQIDTGNGNEHMAWSEDLFVLPSHRRRGIGRRLLGELARAARASDRSLLLCGHEARSSDGAAFAAAMGGRPGNHERQNRAPIADLDRGMLEQWCAEAPAGYSLVQFDGAAPDDLVERIVVAEDAMNDAPRAESLDRFVFTVERRRAGECDLAADGAEYWFAGAVHDATGDVAGFTELVSRDRQPWLVQQEDTCVVPAHRGHAIGRWLKAVNALRVLDERPDARVIETWNDGTNKWMLAINDAMGFRPVATWIETELDV
jgi:GNAT superfamily N-acetyltransferase